MYVCMPQCSVVPIRMQNNEIPVVSRANQFDTLGLQFLVILWACHADFQKFTTFFQLNRKTSCNAKTNDDHNNNSKIGNKILRIYVSIYVLYVCM